MDLFFEKLHLNLYKKDPYSNLWLFSCNYPSTDNKISLNCWVLCLLKTVYELNKNETCQNLVWSQSYLINIFSIFYDIYKIKINFFLFVKQFTHTIYITTPYEQIKFVDVVRREIGLKIDFDFYWDGSVSRIKEGEVLV